MLYPLSYEGPVVPDHADVSPGRGVLSRRSLKRALSFTRYKSLYKKEGNLKSITFFSHGMGYRCVVKYNTSCSMEYGLEE
jgi:hypothetical protein